MRNTSIIGRLAVLLVLLTVGAASADLCGDANLDGAVNDTDAVLVFRAAVGMSSTAVTRTSDLDLNGTLTGADAVLALRIAAGLPDTASCTASQVEGLADRANPILRIGAAAIPAGARSAQSTIPCADGGFIIAGETTEEHFDCTDAFLVTNGAIAFDDDPQNETFANTYRAFSLFDLITFEQLVVDGTLIFDFSGEEITVTGTLAASSNLLGTFTDHYSSIVLNDDFIPIEGSVFTEVGNGQGDFASISQMEFNFFRAGITDLTVWFTNGTVERIVDAEGLCASCSSEQQCAEDLGCFPCLENCGSTARVCSVDFVNLDCGPTGVFGPPELCQTCTSDANCGGFLSCFECDHECSGSASRCSSNILFVDCDDGFF